MNADEVNPYQPPETLDEPALDAIPWETEDDTAPPVTHGNLDDPVTIASYSYPGEANLKCIFLDQNGIQAMVLDAEVMSLSVFLSNAIGGVKLVVARRDAERAIELLRQHADISAARAQVAQTLPPIFFRCEDCRAEISFPGHRRGKTETCPKCGEYVDVPD